MPFENYRKVFRTSQRNFERELGTVQTISTNLSSRSTSDSFIKDEVVDSIDNMIERVESLKRKVSS